MQLLLTGGTGFIGSQVAKYLSREGYKITIADDLLSMRQIQYLPSRGIVDWISKDDLMDLSKDVTFIKKFDYVIHQGAISSTTHADFDGVYKSNFQLSKNLAISCAALDIPFIYASSASVYGSAGQKNNNGSLPLNYYALSKYLFDEWIMNYAPAPRYLGLRYFNVYGPGESFKAGMASMVFHAYSQIKATGKVSLFDGDSQVGPGEHKRDFIYVNDICEIIHWALNNRWTSSIVDVGTGKPETFNNLARFTFDALGITPRIEYIPMPVSLMNQYQAFTRADSNDLIKLGYTRKVTTLESGINKYLKHLENNE